jgi:hypothetical protein
VVFHIKSDEAVLSTASVLAVDKSVAQLDVV